MKPIEILTQALELIAALAAAPLFLGWVNQCRAWLQNRRAPSIWLPYRGIRKLFHKDAVIAENASPLFRVAPYIVFGAMVVAAGIIPSMGTRLPFTIAADAIALVGLLATARVFLSLAAMDIGTAFGTLGARREMMVGFPRRARPADGHLRRLDHLRDHGAARPSRRISPRRRSAFIRVWRSRPSLSRWCCSPRMRASPSTIRRRTSNSR